jgi:hypothetical protein
MKKMLLIVAILLSSCMTIPYHNEQGKEIGYMIQSPVNDVAYIEKQAKELCPKGYIVRHHMAMATYIECLDADTTTKTLQ